jgi:hypothetical protein
MTDEQCKEAIQNILVTVIEDLEPYARQLANSKAKRIPVEMGAKIRGIPLKLTAEIVIEE